MPFPVTIVPDGAPPFVQSTLTGGIVSMVASGGAPICLVDSGAPPIFIENAAPVNQVLPHVTSPTLFVGDTATTTDGTWLSSPAPTFSYQWLRQGNPIVGAPDQNTYVFQSSDEGSAIQCRVTATNPSGSSNATSNARGPIALPLSAPVNTAPPIASGNAVVGQSTDCGNGLWTGNPDPTFTYQWQRDQVDIPGATSDTYNVIEDDLGAMLRVVVTATNSQGSASAPSNEMGPVTA